MDSRIHYEQIKIQDLRPLLVFTIQCLGTQLWLITVYSYIEYGQQVVRVGGLELQDSLIGNWKGKLLLRTPHTSKPPTRTTC